MKKLWSICLTVILLGSPLIAQAGMVGSNAVLETQIEALYSNEQLMQQLADLGISEADLAERLAQLTPAERAQFSNNLSQMPAGQDIFSLAFTLFLVFIITDMLGATDLLPFVHKI